MKPNSNEPIDKRLVVSSVDDLILESTWLNENGDNTAYAGMIVGIKGTGAYILKSLPVTSLSNWEEVGSKVTSTSELVNDSNYVNTTELSSAINAIPSYSLPTATSSVLGGVKTGTNITNSSGTISVATATSSALGVMKVGTNLSVSSGTVSVPTSTSSVLGVVKNGTNISNSSGTLSVATATSSVLGLVKPSTGLTVSSGTLTANLTNSLTSTSTTSALTAYQGYLLKQTLDGYATSISTTTLKVKSGIYYDNSAYYELITGTTAGAVYVGPGYSNVSSLSTQVTNLRGMNVRLYAHTGGSVYLGSSGSVAVSSDENIKEIYDMSEKHIQFFDNLKPITYKYIGEEYSRLHIGFGAQSVEKALLEAGLETKDFGGLVIQKNIKEPDKEGNLTIDIEERYALRMEEFIALNTLKIKSLEETIKNQQILINKILEKIDL